MDLSPLIKKLNQSQVAFLCAADAIPAGLWRARPNAEAWSAAEVVAHLVVVERGVVGSAQRVIQQQPEPIRFGMRTHWPLWLVETRLIPRKSPIPLDPTLIDGKERMMEQLRQTRDVAVGFLAGTRARDLHMYQWRHPFLGSLDFYEWFEMIAAHLARHAKQIKEICVRLPKVV
jgi:DinB superfamily